MNRLPSQPIHALFPMTPPSPLGLSAACADEPALAVPAVPVESVTDTTDCQRAQEALRESEQKYRSLFDHMSEGFALHEILCDADGRPLDYRFLEVNPAFERLTGLTRPQVVGRTFRQVLPGEDDRWLKTYAQVALTGRPAQFEKYSPVLGKHYEVLAYCPRRGQFATIFMDVTRRKLSEQAIMESESRFRTMADGLPLIVWVHGADGQQQFVNRTFCEFFGLAADEVRAERWKQLLHPQDAAQYIQKFADAVERREAFRAKVRVRRADGQWRWLESWAHPRWGESGQFLGMVGTSADITERIAAEQALLESEQRFRATFEQAAVGIAHVAVDGQWLRVNRRYCQIVGYEPEELQALTFQQITHPQDLEADLAYAQQLLAGQIDSYSMEKRYIRGDGGIVWVNLFGTLVRDEQQQPAYFIAVAQDITEARRRRQAEIQRLNRTLKALSDSSQAMGRACDEAQYLSEVCRIIVEDCGHSMVWIGYAQDDTEKSVRPMAWSGFDEGYLSSLQITWGDRERGHGPTGSAIRSGQVQVCRDIQSDPRLAPWRSEAVARGYRASIALPLLREGRAFGVLTIYSAEPDPFTDSEVALLRDLADDLAAGINSIRLRRSAAEDHAALARIHELSARLVSQDDLQTLLQEVIDAAVAISGSRQGTLQLTENGALRLMAQQGFEAPFLDYFAVVHEQGASCGEAFRQRRRIIVPDVTQSEIFAGTESLNVLLAAGVRSCQSTPLVARDGTILGSFSTHWPTPHVPDEGTLQRLDLLARDAAHLIEHRRREQALAAAKQAAERAREAAETANRAKDHFLAVLSHELRTPLNPALMAATILENSPQLPPDLRQDVGIIRRNVELEARLIDDMLDLTRIARGKLTLNLRVVDAREVIGHAVQTCQAEAQDKELSLEVHAPPEPIWVHADPARLQQVFWNLLKNAIKFTPDHGTISVTAQLSARGGLRAQVRDTGRGIEREALARIFQAFEQGGGSITRRYGGLGLGLAICRGLVLMHEGIIYALSDGPGKGASFVVELPPLPQPTAEGKLPCARTASPARHNAPHSGRRILLVEDHPSTALLTSRLLRSFGHEVSTADCIQSALALFEQEHFDLLISDLGLPDGSGQDLLRRLLQNRPVRAIALSGYGMEADVHQSIEAGFLEHLIKPINVRQLEDAINRALRVAARR